MSGHSKWATIHRSKEVKDSKRGAIFTKMAAAITVAVRQGGGIGDPDKNFRLRLAMDKARQFNMPKENMNRAIEKGTGGAGGIALEEAVFEGFLPGGAAVMVEVTTDNRLRTGQQVRTVLDKNGGSMGSSGSVAYMFLHQGELVVDPGGKLEEAELKIMDLGVNDLDNDDMKIYVYCDKEKTYEIKKQIEDLGYKVETAQLVMKPNTVVEVSDEETRGKIERVVELLEELDDVAAVWSNYA